MQNEQATRQTAKDNFQMISLITKVATGGVL